MEAQNDVQKLAELIDDIDMAMLTTVADDGSLRSRPMRTQSPKEFDGTLWFLTEASSKKVTEIDHNHKVNLSYADPKNNKFVSVSGDAQEVNDREKVKELWQPIYKAWFPKGPEDPNVVALRVKVEKAEYWDSATSPVVYLVGFAKAVLTGEKYHDEASQHGQVQMS